MRILFLFPYPLDEAPSQRFRFEQYFQFLKSEGIEYSGQPFWSPGTWRILYQPGRLLTKLSGFVMGLINRTRILFSLEKFDVVFIHRECAPLGPPVFEWIISGLKGKKIIYDFDDAIWLPNTSLENNLISILKWHSKVSTICRWSYKVSCGNAYLASFANRYNASVVVNPTTIDTDNLHCPQQHSTEDQDLITIGWTGTHSTLHYLAPLIPVIAALSEKYPTIQLLVIADRKPDFALECLRYRPWNKLTEISDLLTIDIGVMPLTQDPWAEGKCGFKALQYMSLEKPVLASPVGINTRIVDHGENGFLCSTPAAWRQHLTYLIEREDERIRLGKNGRQKVIQSYSVRSNRANFLALFE